jgi:Fe-S cluster assembly iron-binding protein IscA
VLNMTSDAAALLKEARNAAEVPDEYGVRIFAEQNTETGVSIGLGFAEAPFPGDEISEQEGVRLFVAQEVAGPLASTTIDAAKDDGEARLVLRPSEENNGGAAES